MNQSRQVRFNTGLRPLRKLMLGQVLFGVALAGFYQAPATAAFKKDPIMVTADRSLAGKVTDENGAGLPGVSVIVKGSSTGTVSDAEGQYTINVPESGSPVLVFSFVGYVPKEITVGNQTSLDVQLAVDNKALEEVVVVGYGSQRKRDITSAVSNINMNDIGEVPKSNVTRMLQGQAPGVIIKQKSGTPGQQFEVKVRGISSLGAGSDPLYVIDGFPVGTSVGQNLNPNDIEDVTILKDAASTAIYGARGSNGVVQITTKSAKEGKTSLNVSIDYGIQNVPDGRKTKVLNGQDFAQFKKEVFIGRFVLANKRQPTNEEIPLDFRNPADTKYSTNWFDLILHNNAAYKDINVSLSSGKGPIKSMVSIGYYKEDGALKYTDYDRASVRTNLSGAINKFISMGVNIAGSYSRSSLAATDGRSALVGLTLISDPRYPAYDEKGELIPYYNGVGDIFGFPNPLYLLKAINRDRNIADVLSNGYIDFNIAKGLKFRTSVNAKINYNKYKEYVPSTIGLAIATGTNGAPPRIASERDDVEELRNYTADQLLTYNVNFGANHHLDAMLGYTAQQEVVKGLYGSGNTFPDDLAPFLGNATIRSSNSMERKWTMLAYLARLNYSFKDRYLLSASFRREGSSRFSEGHQFGNFPAVSVGWRLSEESFIPKAAWLTDLKLRGSWGMTGNNTYQVTANNNFGTGQNAGDDGNYASLAFLGLNNYVFNNTLSPGKTVTRFANSELTWEKSNQLNIGLDLSTFNNRLVFTVEYYKKITDDMLLGYNIPAVSGFTSTLKNLGKVQNQGVEIAGSYRVKLGQVNFRTNANITFNRSKILAIRGQNDFILQGSQYGGYNIQQVGRPIGMIFGYKKLGIFNTQAEIDAAPLQEGAVPGAMKFADLHGAPDGGPDGIVSYDTKDMTEIGNPNPKFNWGWTVGAEYKRFDVSILLMGAYKFDIYRNIEASTMNMDGVFNVLEKAKDRWRSPENPGSNPNAKNSQGGTDYFKWSRESSERYVYDGTHTWIKNVTIGYTLPKVDGILSDARIFINAANLLLITKYPGNNPDAGVRGGTELNNDDESYPVPRTFSAGIKVNF
ncbi:TonB-linked SusC/RagA family outer membrane protein [Dyadobacter sp. BE34]|uniref:TonB-linked SusC/RagA family outer membrane protein n=1 Tax=Dyadobacter fermentans TaxID=94254 RepID=A0ABU1QXE7_9BACT|nr:MULTISPECIES: TonB-dependent receptor [Dyadobacter]MDR6805829.1 TonB-linked SusC/RagA family outer membrane protein [Dyadobacter fermentans]MDR7042410.1 TonB-linked SusC/RagA family outer membrane protein [Dyadobacter sp. BE242]MDR7196723.1 TonB-linked SusC/RagA family outer membrane protein [Dyadobacter sp. BE34]MDR7215843.1 TonB-linked SusC/RagA family outer membrane protein [Dyadobacter sp. BE31]MDR7263379.1 TonB-linked SusC/RagA family outer membrane protein [Dyadobacter sp. BE32]